MRLLRISQKANNSLIKPRVRKAIPFQKSLFQSTEKDLFLRRINNKKRGISKPKYIERRYRVLIKVIAAGLVVFVLIYFIRGWFLTSNKLKFENVEVVGVKKFVNQNDIHNLINSNILDKNYFLVDPSHLEKVVLKNFLAVKEVQVQKKFPNDMTVYIEERVPIAIISKLNAGRSQEAESYLIDSDGFVLGMVEKDFMSLPKVNYDGDISIGSFLEKDIVPISIEIIKESEKAGLKISSLSFNPKYTKMYVGSGVEVFIGNDKNKKNSIQVIGALVKKTALDGKFLKKVDLRYDKVIVLYD